MKSSAKKIELASVDDLFSTEEGRQDAKLEKIQEIPLSELHPFRNHPFKVKDDEAMMETADSIKQYGVLVPAIARPDPEGGYELVAGHRRHRASELAEKETMPVIVRDLDDDAATIIMVDELMDMVDEKKIALNPPMSCPFSKGEEQVDLLDAMDSEQAYPSLSQAQRLKKYSQEGHPGYDVSSWVRKRKDLDRVTFTSDTLRGSKLYAPADAGNHHQVAGGMAEKRQRDQER